MICSDIWHKYHECYFEIVIRHMWIEFVVGSLPCSERFSPVRTPAFPSPQKPTLPIRSGTHGQVETTSYELLFASWVNERFTIIIFYAKFHEPLGEWNLAQF